MAKVLTDRQKEVKKKVVCVMGALLLCKRRSWWVQEMIVVCSKAIRCPEVLTITELELVELIHQKIEEDANEAGCLNLSGKCKDGCKCCREIFKDLLSGKKPQKACYGSNKCKC